MLLLVSGVVAAEEPPSPVAVPEDRVLLIDSFGNVVIVPSSRLPKSLLPPAEVGLERQVPAPQRGAQQPAEVGQRIQDNAGTTTTSFPALQPRLAPYLANIDELGNTAIRPGPLLDVILIDSLVQDAKYWLGRRGLRYSLRQTVEYAALSDPAAGARDLGFYTLDLQGKWAVYNSPASGNAGWVSFQIAAKTGIGSAGQTQDAQTNLGTLSDPTGTWSSRNGFRAQEIAWQQSLDHGKVVIVAGRMNQSNYMDANAYADTGRGQFMNTALIDSMVVPLPAYGYGLNAQWQPGPDGYTMLGVSVGSGQAGVLPAEQFDPNVWSLVSETGWTPSNFLGLGPGTYRIQPFLARDGGPIQGGVGFNFQQRLGEHSPFGWFGRVGVGGSTVTDGASTQVSTGVVMQGPLACIGLVPRLTNDLAGVGFVWSQPGAAEHTVYHRNEYVFETFYTLQLTPTARVQADYQVIWNPVFNPNPGPVSVFQLQFILGW